MATKVDINEYQRNILFENAQISEVKKYFPDASLRVEFTKHQNHLIFNSKEVNGNYNRFIFQPTDYSQQKFNDYPSYKPYLNIQFVYRINFKYNEIDHSIDIGSKPYRDSEYSVMSWSYYNNMELSINLPDSRSITKNKEFNHIYYKEKFDQIVTDMCMRKINAGGTIKFNQQSYLPEKLKNFINFI